MRTRAILIAGAMMIATGGLAFAHGGATGIVKERMDAMTDMKNAVKTLTAIMRGETAYDAGTVKKEAAVIRSHAGEAMTKLFPADSDNTNSEAKQEVWSNWDGFTALAERLETLASQTKDKFLVALITVIGNSKDAKTADGRELHDQGPHHGSPRRTGVPGDSPAGQASYLRHARRRREGRSGGDSLGKGLPQNTRPRPVSQPSDHLGPRSDEH